MKFGDFGEKKIAPVLIFVGFLLLTGFVFLPILTSNSRQQDIYSGWADSNNPCFPVEQMKKYWRENYNREAAFLQCIPLHVIVEWDIEENFIRSTGVGNDRVKLLLQDEFPAYLEMTYDQESMKRLVAFNILGPSPCCPGPVDANLMNVDAALVVCDSWGENCRTFSTVDSLLFQVIPKTDNFFGFTWQQDATQRSGGFGSSRIRLPSSIIPGRGSGGVLYEESFRIKVYGEDSLSWEEIQTGLEEGEVVREFPINIRTPLPANQLRSQEGSATVTIQFGEEELERWAVRVEGWEKDTFHLPIEFKDPKGNPQQCPIVVDFQWILEGEFTIAKRGMTRSYKEGRITQAALIPRIIYGSRDLFRCDFVKCKDQEDISIMMEGAYLDGSVTDNNVVLKWRKFYPAACVLCSPRVSFIKITPYREQFGNKEFTRKISEENLLLKDGYSATGGIGDWLYYKITLTKLD